MTTTKGLEIKQVSNGLYLRIKRNGVIYGQHYEITDRIQATRLFLALVDKYRTKGALAVMGGW
jgi:hypothetical protein